jgi:hypothetical protein
LKASITAALTKTTDRETKAHLEGARDQIAKILDPKFSTAPGNAAPVIRIGIDGSDPFWALPGQTDICWRDYVIRPE